MNEGDDLSRSLEQLVSLGRTPDVDIRPVLLRVVVDLFVRRPGHSPSEIRQFEEITLRLLDTADPPGRLAVAAKLARHPASPRALLAAFLTEGGPPAASVLAHASLDREILLRTANWGAHDAAVAVATRQDLDESVAKALAERPERQILIALARNLSAAVDRGTFQYLVRRARGDDELGRALLARNGAQASDVTPLFFLASAAKRAAIILAARREDLGPDHRRRRRLAPDEQEALRSVERAILSPDRDGLEAALAAALHVPLADAWRILDDPRGEPLALALAAVAAPAELAARLFILSAPTISRSVLTVRMLTDVVENGPMRTAKRLIGAMLGLPERSPKRAPADDEATPRHRADSGLRPLSSQRERSEGQIAARVATRL